MKKPEDFGIRPIELCEKCVRMGPICSADGERIWYCFHTLSIYGRSIKTGAQFTYDQVTPEEAMELAHQFRIFHGAKAGALVDPPAQS